MAEAFTWAHDATTGVYKNHALTREFLFHAALRVKIFQFTQTVKGYGKHQGSTIDIPYFKSLSVPTNYGQLDETVRIPIDQIQMGTRQIEVVEWGRGVEYTSLAADLSKVDINNVVQKALLDQMNRCMDVAAAQGFKGAKVCFIPTSLTGGTWDTDGTPSTSASQNLTFKHLGVIRDYMVKDLHVPGYQGKNISGDHYIALASTKALRGLKDDRDLIAWNMYLRKGDIFFNSEVGMQEGIRFIEVAHESALSNSVGTGSVLGEVLIFGDEAVMRAEIESPHLRLQPNLMADFGRRRGVAWYGTLAFGTKWNTANDREAKIVRVCSS